MDKKINDSRISHISNSLYDSMHIKDIESRLESDPLLPGGLIELEDRTENTDGICLWNNCDQELVINKS